MDRDRRAQRHGTVKKYICRLRAAADATVLVDQRSGPGVDPGFPPDIIVRDEQISTDRSQTAEIYDASALVNHLGL